MKQQHYRKQSYRKKEPRLEDELIATLISISVVSRALAKKVMIHSLIKPNEGKRGHELWAR